MSLLRLFRVARQPLLTFGAAVALVLMTVSASDAPDHHQVHLLCGRGRTRQERGDVGGERRPGDDRDARRDENQPGANGPPRRRRTHFKYNKTGLATDEHRYTRMKAKPCKKNRNDSQDLQQKNLPVLWT